MIMDELGQCAKMADDELIMQITFPHQYYLITLQEKSWMHEVVFFEKVELGRRIELLPGQ